MSDGVSIRFDFEGKQRAILPGGEVPLLVPGLRDLVDHWIRQKATLSEKIVELNSRLAEIQPLHWEVEVAKAKMALVQSQVTRVMRMMIPAAEMDRWEGSFVLDVEKKAIVFQPGAKEGA